MSLGHTGLALLARALGAAEGLAVLARQEVAAVARRTVVLLLSTSRTLDRLLRGTVRLLWARAAPTLLAVAGVGLAQELERGLKTFGNLLRDALQLPFSKYSPAWQLLQ